MSRFLVVRTPDHLARACAGASALAALQRREAPTDVALLGAWVEHPFEPGESAGLAAPALLSTGPSPVVRASSELAGVWAVCQTVPLSRLALMDALVASLGADARRRGRFVPIVPDGAFDWRQECATLAARYPDLVLPPIVQAADGALRIGDLRWAEAAGCFGTVPRGT